MNMHRTTLYSVLLELQAQHEAHLPATMGHQIHAMFLQLIARADPALSVRLHDEPVYRPFTLSPLLGGVSHGNRVALFPGPTYHVRVTLLDGGKLWDCLSTLLLETGPVEVRLGEASFKATRLISTEASDPTSWAARTSWQQLVSTPLRRTITLTFASPTAFNMSGSYFALFPEPPLVWESLIRVWNRCAPDSLKMEKQEAQVFLRHHVNVSACDLSTRTLHYPNYTQKGFCGRCRYQMTGSDEHARMLTVLAEFARYAGIGYKTTMGMGQARRENPGQETLQFEFLPEAVMQEIDEEPLAAPCELLGHETSSKRTR
jgi:CRISPR-associated endoribonuclease Cas6